MLKISGILYMLSLKMSFHTELQPNTNINPWACDFFFFEHLVLIGHIHLKEDIYRILLDSWYLLFSMPLHCRLVTSNGRLDGSTSFTYGDFLCICIEVGSMLELYVVWAKKICLFSIRVGMEISLPVLTFDSMGVSEVTWHYLWFRQCLN